MQLHYQYQQHENSQNATIVFVHGLFGSLSNLGMLARHYAKDYSVVQLDVRNHGLSPHADEHHYAVLAADVLETLDALNITRCILVGHSMGAKIVMQLAHLKPELVEKLVVLDMSPSPYDENHHAEIFQALFAVAEAQVNSRIAAADIMRQYLSEEMIIQFLLKSFNKGQWLFNVQVLYERYQDILDWKTFEKALDIPSLFLKGGNSFYISKDAHFKAIEQQFTHAKIITIDGAGHWLHGEKTAEVLAQMDEFLN